MQISMSTKRMKKYLYQQLKCPFTFISDKVTFFVQVKILMVYSAKPLLGHHALVRVVGFRMAGFMLSGSGIRVFVHGNVELGWGGWGKVQFNVGG